MKLNESVVEECTCDYFRELGYEYRFGPDVAPGEPQALRDDYTEVILKTHLGGAIDRLNPDSPRAAREEALRQATLLNTPSLYQNNRRFHRMMVNGVEVEYPAGEGRIKGDRISLVDFDNLHNNHWMVINQFSVTEGNRTRRPDVVVFVNGIPLGVIELKNPTDEKATIWSAFNQLQTYKQQVPSLLAYNEVLVISDGIEARVGSLTADRERFMPWKTVDGKETAPARLLQLQVLIKGVFDKSRFLDYVKHFVVFEEEGSKIKKKIAGYHQFHAVRKAVETTLKATAPKGDNRCGVVWHTQGSGKSLTMAFYAGKVIKSPRMKNPTLIVITDRNDLDDQLFGTFANCKDLIRQEPVQINSREELRDKLQVAAGGVFFTTVQKFSPEGDLTEFPLLSDRSNIVVIADEAHRSQYGFKGKLREGIMKYGFAKYIRDALPNASFIGFTGTPIELTDKNTKAVFGNYIDIYDIQQAVNDGATVKIYYESRLAKLDLNQGEITSLDEQFEEVTEGEEESLREKQKTRWTALQAIVGSDKRLTLIANDIVNHLEKRLEILDGKTPPGVNLQKLFDIGSRYPDFDDQERTFLLLLKVTHLVN